MATDYFSTSRPTQLATALDATTATVTVLDGVTYPDPALTGKQYTVLLAYGSDREEICTVTAKPTASSFTVIRGQDGTPATAKNIGDTVVHGVSARDFNRVNALESEIAALEGADTALAARVSAVETALPGKVNDVGDTLTGDLVMGGHKVTGLADATADTDALAFKQAADKFVDVAGDTMTGNLVIDRGATGAAETIRSTGSYAELRVDSAVAQSAGVLLQKVGNTRWKIQGTATTDDLAIGRYTGASAYQDSPLKILNADGQVLLLKDPTAALGVATKQYADGAGWVMNLSESIPSNASGQYAVNYLSGSAGWGTGIARAGDGIKVTKAGWYEVSFNGGFSSTPGGTIRAMAIAGAAFASLGVNRIGAYAPPSNTSGWGAVLSATGLVYLDANDVVYVWARQDSGAALTATATLCVALSRAG